MSRKPRSPVSASQASLADRCRSSFDPVIRLRGDDYFKSGHIFDFLDAPGGAVAKVKGSRVYHVRLLWGPRRAGEIHGTCTCPYYEDGALCKHLWALILEIDRRGHGKAIPGPRTLTVTHDFEEDAEDWDWADEDDKDDYDDDVRPQSDFKPWRATIHFLQQESARHAPTTSEAASHSPRRTRLAFYVLDPTANVDGEELNIQFFHRERLQDNSFGQLKRSQVGKDDLPLYEEAADREILALLLLQERMAETSGSFHFTDLEDSARRYDRASLMDTTHEILLRKMATTGRLVRLPGGRKDPIPVIFDDGPPWNFELTVEAQAGSYSLSGRLVREGEAVPISRPSTVLESGLIISSDRISKLSDIRHFAWLTILRSQKLEPIPALEIDELIETLSSGDGLPPIHWPADLKWSQVSMTPVPVLLIAPGDASPTTTASVLPTELRFLYGEVDLPQGKPGPHVFDKNNRRLIARDLEFEKSCAEKLETLPGLGRATTLNSRVLKSQIPLGIAKHAFADVAATALEWGWLVKAFGRKIARPIDFDIEVRSGVDWFELRSKAVFDNGPHLTTPELLAALVKRDPLIQLGNGMTGLLPQKWLERYGALAEIGSATSSGLRFNRAQGALMAAWIGTDQIKADPDFSALREAVFSFNDLKPREPHTSFRGELRPYQKEGLAWLDFLGRVGFGGILADDMGLGKTVQVLSHLQEHYARMPKKDHRPTLIVVPKSLVFNWQDEAARFTPNLRVISYSGSERGHRLRLFETHDIVLVTYATLRRDIEDISQKEFHYVIADEAQAIKNPASRVHRACLALRARHRLAMTGTPVENSALDLMALLDFVSPGLLGRGLRERMTRAAAHTRIDTETLRQLSTALKPFILRRTKDQVLSDLPDKTEKVIHVELSGPELRRYRELRDHYRTRLKMEFARSGGISKSKIAVLEALLRLRQAACHPGLIDQKLAPLASSKTEILLEQIQEIVAEGHKALVFSQFTSFLDIVQGALEKAAITCVRLDGKTSEAKRRESVSRFQSDPNLRVFLISLKAGGVGLNLTAADYVFILDPWWNPAAEAQAIDRAHRIGQKSKVIAYRLIAKDTVEEKIIELQKQKRDIADAIISEDASLMQKITADDLETLLS